MSGPPVAKSMSFADQEARSVLGPAGNKARSVELRKPVVKLKSEKVLHSSETAFQAPEMTVEQIPSPVGFRKSVSNAASVLRQRQHNLSLNASCSSEASTDSSHSRASTGRISRRTSASTPPLRRKQQCGWKGEKIEKMEGNGKIIGAESECTMVDGSMVKKRCAWVTSNTEPLYTVFHDEEWGLPVHDDKKLFELLSLSTALAELTWPAILSKRHIFRDVFMDFDPVAVSKLNDKKIALPGSPASSLLSELKLRAIIENAHQICKIIDEIGSFDKYIWSFVNYKPIVSNFRYPRQVPIKTSKADTISKDLVRRGFRGVGPTVVYSFMQVSGITNDHLVSCFRYHDCIIASDMGCKNNDETESKNKDKPSEDQLDLSGDIDDLNLSR
ncbi:uncharacterized protein LOC127239891 [Andrographis paniculata]|uniref:uncharacterized protein LOC127239891 n=1 Tax=Andrographis paniculata TaxID=175694 RepID=UPI0021E7092F|nr:uncharacterized protein LOC127239891 [Andrographis paniculata]